MDIDPSGYVYDGNGAAPAVTVEGMTEGVNYIVTYGDDVNPGNINAGECTVTVTLIGNRSGSYTKTFEIGKADLATLEGAAMIALPDSGYTYNGVQKKPEGTIAGLRAGSDFTVSYENNVNAGTACAVFTGTGNYTGTIRKEFTIDNADLTQLSENVSLEYEAAPYSGHALKPSVMITPLAEGEDFTVAYADNNAAGTATVTISGIGNYVGSLSRTFVIEQGNLGDLDGRVSLVLTGDDTTYDGTEKKPAVRIPGLTEGVDYEVTYANNVSDGEATVTVTGKGSYSGTVTKTFQIAKGSTLALADTVTIDVPEGGAGYDGTPQTPAVLIPRGDGTYYEEGVDYIVEYSDNTEPGTATVTITGIGSLNGTITKTFTIRQREISEYLPVASLEYTSAYYDGKAKTPGLTIEGIEAGVDYKVTYNNNVETGTATVTITGIGDYIGTATMTFMIVPRPVLLAAATSRTANTATFTWNAISGATRYLVYFGSCSSGAKFVQYTWTKADIRKYTIRNLAKNGQYKFRIIAETGNDETGYTAICSSTINHFVTGKNKKYTNIKKVKAKSKLTIKKGKTKKVKGKVVKARKGKKMLGKNHCAKLRYMTSNASIATVDSKGRIRGRRKGTCTVYVISANGTWKAIKVTIK